MMKALHGEVIFVETKVPETAKKINIKNDYYIVGESEVHGNDHRVEVKEGVFLYECAGKLYLKNEVECEVYCPNVDRHDTKTLPPSEWEIKKANDFDFLADKERVVRD